MSIRVLPWRDMGRRNAKALADAVRYRRISLGYFPRAKWPKTARIKESTLRKFESGRYVNFDQDTIWALELDLGWAQGSVEAVWAGGQPRVIEQTG